jgi:hypothetical protein
MPADGVPVADAQQGLAAVEVALGGSAARRTRRHAGLRDRLTRPADGLRDGRVPPLAKRPAPAA